jgi:hypothetical protein
LNHVDQVDWEQGVHNLQDLIELGKHVYVLSKVGVHIPHTVVKVEKAVVVNNIVLNTVDLGTVKFNT